LRDGLRGVAVYHAEQVRDLWGEETVGGALDAVAYVEQDVGVDHGRAEILVAE